FEHTQVPYRVVLPNQDILATVIAHSDLSVFCSDVISHKFARAGIIVSSLYWLIQCGKTKGQAFTESFLTGADLQVSNPIYALRERVINDRKLLGDKRSRVIVSA